MAATVLEFSLNYFYIYIRRSLKVRNSNLGTQPLNELNVVRVNWLSAVRVCDQRRKEHKSVLRPKTVKHSNSNISLYTVCCTVMSRA